VRIVAEGNYLVAYGFAHQRIAIPAESVAKVILTRGPSAVVLLDRDDRMLFKASGSWDPHELGQVCARAGGPSPTTQSRVASGTGRARSSAGRSSRQRRKQPKWQRANGYRRLRVRPRGFAAGMFVLGIVATALGGFGGFVGALPAVALPGSVGSVRNLIGIAGALAGVTAGLWLFGLCVRAGLAAIRWSAASAKLGSLAPWSPFYPRRAKRAWPGKLLTAAMAVAVPALIGWGPGIGIVTLVHGFSDQALVSHLRTVGARTQGVVVGIPQYSTDSDGNTTVTYQANLEFNAGQQQVQTPDPAIGGRIWPIGNGVVPIVYDPANPATAAVAGQLVGSPWGGAPLGNLISSALLTLALPVLIWRLVLRLTRRSRGAREDMLDGIW
jgi:hypothetical protein